MKKITLTIGPLLICILSFGQTKNFIDQPYLETTAKVDTLVKPDIIYLDILIREKDEKNIVSVEELENRMTDKLESLGIDIQKQLTLSDLASNFKKYFLKQKDILKIKAYKLKVFDAQTAGKVLVGLEEIGISNVNLGKTEYSKTEEMTLYLKSKAVEKAKIQADYLVRPLGQKVSAAIHISDKYYQNFDKFNGELKEIVVLGYSAKQKQEYQPIEIEFKPIKLESEVTIKFKIE